MITRRDVLRALALAASPLGCARTPRVAQPASAPAPHHIVRITLDGGFDSVLTVDAKDARTAGEVDVLYRGDERVRGAQRLFGPMIGGLARHDRALCLVHGVRHDTVAHDTGEGILRAGRTRFSGNTPPFGDVVGELLPGGAPIRHLHLQTGEPEPFSESLDLALLPGNPAGRMLPMAGQIDIDAGTIAQLYDAAAPAPFALPPWLADVQRANREEAHAILRDPAAEAAYAAAQRQTGDLSQLLATADRQVRLRASPLGPGLELALHALTHNLARFVTVRSPRTWLDTHTDNLALQRARTLPLLDDIADFIDRLARTPAGTGSLLDRTTIAIASELGRFPRLNMARGKDHWPETSWILLGRGVRPGITIGQTDAQFRGRAVDYRTGRLDGAARPIDADALFATLLRIAGGDPVKHDYERDHVLECALA